MKEVLPTSTDPNIRRCVGSIIGASFIVLIFISGYSLFLLNTKSQMWRARVGSVAAEKKIVQLP